MNDEYEVSPLTFGLVKKFENNLETFNRDGSQDGLQAMANDIHEIDDFDKGHIIIDLLVLLATAMRALTEHQLPKLDD